MPNYKRCSRCRQDHKSCAPENRDSGTRCQRCEKYNYECSSGVAKQDDPNVLKCSPCRRFKQTCVRRGKWPTRCQRCLKEGRYCTDSYTARTDPKIATLLVSDVRSPDAIATLKPRHTDDLLLEHDLLSYLLSTQSDFIHMDWFPNVRHHAKIKFLWSSKLFDVRLAAAKRRKTLMEDFQVAIRANAVNGRHQEAQILSSSLVSPLALPELSDLINLPIELQRELVEVDLRTNRLCAALYKQQCILLATTCNSDAPSKPQANNQHDIDKWLEINERTLELSDTVWLRITSRLFVDDRTQYFFESSAIDPLSTPLHRMCCIQNIDTLHIKRILRKWPSLLNSRNIAGETPLHVSIRLKNLQSAEFLLREGADYHLRDENGRLPLMWVYYHRLWELIPTLTTNIGNLDEFDIKGSSGVFQLEFSQDPFRLTLLHLLCHRGNGAELRRIIDDGWDINKILSSEISTKPPDIRMTALKAAVSGRNIELLQILISCWHDIPERQNGCTGALHFALDNLWLAEAHFLIEYADDTALDLYARQLISIVKDKNLSPEKTREWCLDKISVLLSFFFDFGGETIPQELLTLAISCNNSGLVTQILDTIASSNYRNGEDIICAPLNLIVQTLDRRAMLIQTLQRSDIDANDIDEHGKTALHRAIEARSVEYIHILLEYGALPDKQSGHGRSPIELAQWMKLPNILEIFRQNGFDIPISSEAGDSLTSLPNPAQEALVLHSSSEDDYSEDDELSPEENLNEAMEVEGLS